MKKLSVTFLLLLAIGVFPMFVNGQKKMVKDYNKTAVTVVPEVVLVTANNPVLVKKGDDVKFDISIKFPAKYMSPKAVMRYAVVDKDGNQIIDPIFAIGTKAKAEGTRINKKTGGEIKLSKTVSYKPNLLNTEVFLTSVIFTPKKKNPAKLTSTVEQIVEGNKKTYLMEPKSIANTTVTTQDLVQIEGKNGGMIMIETGNRYEKETIISKSANYYFPKNKSEIDLKFGLNNTEPAKQALDSLKAFMKKGYAIKDLTINGFASPEGEETFNQGLSDNRAKNADKAAAKFVAKGTKIPYAGNGPDWNGFLKLIQASNIKDKNTIVNVINSANPQQKETEIKNMILTYPELEETILPQLRRAEISINCYEPKKTDSEILNLALTNPSKLTIEEILYASDKLAQNDNDRVKILNNAITISGNDSRPYNNLAVIEVRQGDITAAANNIKKANSLNPNDKDIMNNMGVVYAAQGNYKEAKTYFAKVNNSASAYNIGICNLVEGNWDEASKALNKKCDYNSALAKTMLKDYTASATMLNCATKTAETLYLQAINESRQGNNDKCLEYLRESIKMDNNKKAQASNDVEFINLFSNTAFQSLVK